MYAKARRGMAEFSAEKRQVLQQECCSPGAEQCFIFRRPLCREQSSRAAPA